MINGIRVTLDKYNYLDSSLPIRCASHDSSLHDKGKDVPLKDLNLGDILRQKKVPYTKIPEGFKYKSFRYRFVANSRNIIQKLLRPKEIPEYTYKLIAIQKESGEFNILEELAADDIIRRGLEFGKKFCEDIKAGKYPIEPAKCGITYWLRDIKDGTNIAINEKELDNLHFCKV